jgi:hypothetical protein
MRAVLAAAPALTALVVLAVVIELVRGVTL